jgi:hypothetical protein
MKRAIGRIAALGLLVSALGCTQPYQAKLTGAQRRQCQADGGFESRSPFGGPFCQFRYSDGGKVCRGKADCSGQCLSDPPENPQGVEVGTPIAGRCEAERSTFGCHARVEDGKLAEVYTCIE